MKTIAYALSLSFLLAGCASHLRVADTPVDASQGPWGKPFGQKMASSYARCLESQQGNESADELCAATYSVPGRTK